MNQSLNCVELLTEASGSKSNGSFQFSGKGVNWKIYLEKGQLRGAANSIRLPFALNYHLRKLGFTSLINTIKSIPASELEIHNSEGDNWLEGGSWIPCLRWLVSYNHLKLSEADQVLVSLSEEALETCLWLIAGEYKWIEEQSLPQQVTTAGFMSQTFDLVPLIEKFQNRLQTWQEFGSVINSPYQGLFFKPQINPTQPPTPVLLKLSKFLKGLSFRELSILLNQDELIIAQLLLPYIKTGEIQLQEPSFPLNFLPCIPQKVEFSNGTGDILKQQNRFKIACIDDSPIILDEMQRFLGEKNFEIFRIENPLEAASKLLKIKPDLIFMDISMPQINGYKLCSLLKKSSVLKQTPIVMVTGRTGFIDKTRAQMTGASDYLTKPFTRTDLLEAVEKYLPDFALSR
ncbi:CheY-like receiver domain-containing protein [Xenococcus sp. PCC 7305]|uniref:response regulator n=1 Tax=Xenococcus sp. PCC 7305 TaxID=102125 RepID=UPI0002AC82C8|nr:response regulator [Xenococcus sp. PCC 7305]ELS05168.1 CheY-like receiver domain-containing protein [Xenococcus sp. PCC 7305]